MKWSLLSLPLLLTGTVLVLGVSTLVPASNITTPQFPATELHQNVTGSNETLRVKNITGINQVVLNESHQGHNVSANESESAAVSDLSSAGVGNQSKVGRNETKVGQSTVTASEGKSSDVVSRLFKDVNCSVENGTNAESGICEAAHNATGKSQFVANQTKDVNSPATNQTWTALGNGTTESAQNITVVQNNTILTQNVSIFTNSSIKNIISSSITLNISSQQTKVRTTLAPANMIHNATVKPQLFAHNASSPTRNGTLWKSFLQNFTSSTNPSTTVPSSQEKDGNGYTHSLKTASKSGKSTTLRTLISTTSTSQHEQLTSTNEASWKHDGTNKGFMNTVEVTLAPTKKTPHRTFSKELFGHAHGLIWQDQHYVKNVLLPIGCGIAGALMIVCIAYFMKSCRKKKRFAHQQEPKAETTTQMDHVMLLADSSDEEVY